MLISLHEFEIFADYHQFYLEDETWSPNTGDIWNEETVKQMLEVGESFIAVGTARDMTVPVAVEFHDGEQLLELEKYSRVNECSLDVKSDKFVISGCTDYLPDAARIEVKPSIYRVRILYRNLESVVDLDGDDFYVLQLWKEGKMREIAHLKP